jgi:metal-dependent hydrolase (beta-lactamase superfamily II)
MRIVNLADDMAGPRGLQALFVETSEGTVVLLGCAHAGVVSTAIATLAAELGHRCTPGHAGAVFEFED